MLADDGVDECSSGYATTSRNVFYGSSEHAKFPFHESRKGK